MACPIVKGEKALQFVFGIKSHLPPAVRRLVGVDFEVGADGFFEELFYVLQSSGGGTGATSARTLVMDFDLLALRVKKFI